jgi:drug/metabolite transporter (DMT)-like permease
MPLLMVVWGRYLFNLIFVSLFFFRGGSQGIVRTGRLNLQILRAILGLSSTLAFWGALVFLSLADCVAIAFVSPLLVTVLSAPFLGEKVGIHRWGAVIVGFSGAMIIIRPGMGIVHWAVILPVIAALFWANYQIITRILSRTDLRPLKSHLPPCWRPLVIHRYCGPPSWDLSYSVTFPMGGLLPVL